MTIENELAKYNCFDLMSIVEDNHELQIWQDELVAKRLAEANSGEGGLEHSKVFSKLRRRLEKKA